jgi:hypothetical protein
MNYTIGTGTKVHSPNEGFAGVRCGAHLRSKAAPKATDAEVTCTGCLSRSGMAHRGAEVRTLSIAPKAVAAKKTWICPCCHEVMDKLPYDKQIRLHNLASKKCLGL